MKRYIIIIVWSLLYCSCDKDPTLMEKESFSDGSYMGYFVLHDKNYWCAIDFKSDRYEELLSGSAIYQKELSCLTTGTFKLDNSVLSFYLSSYKFPTAPISCDSEKLLPGDYEIHLLSTNDSLIFSKGVEETKITYYLIRIIK